MYPATFEMILSLGLDQH